jgi:hypothetical protein
MSSNEGVRVWCPVIFFKTHVNGGGEGSENEHVYWDQQTRVMETKPGVKSHGDQTGMNHEFMEYMRSSYPDTSLSEFRSVDTYVSDHGGLETLEDDEDDEWPLRW